MTCKITASGSEQGLNLNPGVVERLLTARTAIQPCPGGFTFDNPEAENLVAGMTTEPDDTRKGHIDDLIGALMVAGVWAKLDFLYVLAAHDTQAASLNWKNPGSNALTPTGEPFFIADRGYTGDGTSNYLNTGFVDSPSLIAQQNSKHVGAWVLTHRANNSGEIGSVSDSGSGSQSWIDAFTAAVGGLAVVSGGSAITGASSTSLGWTIGQRTADGSVAGQPQFWRNGVLAASYPFANPSVAPVNRPIVILRSPGGHTNREIAAATWGASLSSGEQTAYYAALNAYIQAVLPTTPPPITYARWDPDRNYISLSNGNKTAFIAPGGVAISNIGKSSGKWYWEISVPDVFSSVGIAETSPGDFVYNASKGTAWRGGFSLTTYKNGVGIDTTLGSFAGAVMGCALDMDNLLFYYYRNGVLASEATINPVSLDAGNYKAAVSRSSTGVGNNSYTANFGATPFAFAPPSGFNAGLYDVFP